MRHIESIGNNVEEPGIFFGEADNPGCQFGIESGIDDDLAGRGDLGILQQLLAEIVYFSSALTGSADKQNQFFGIKPQSFPDRGSRIGTGKEILAGKPAYRFNALGRKGG